MSVIMAHTLIIEPEIIMIKTTCKEASMIVGTTTEQSVTKTSCHMQLTTEVDGKTHIDTTCCNDK